MRAVLGKISRGVASVFCAVLCTIGAGNCAEITLGASGPLRGALGLLTPAFERQSGHKVNVLYASDMAARAATARGEDVDIAIIPGPFDSILASGGVRVESRREIARGSVGLAVKARAERREISTMAGLRAVLLAARRIAVPDAQGALAGAIFEGCLRRLDIDIAGKISRVRGGPAAMVALPREAADLGVAFISEALPEPGIELLGPLPAMCEPEAIFAGFVLKNARDAVAGQALLDYLASPAARADIEASGLHR